MMVEKDKSKRDGKGGRRLGESESAKLQDCAGAAATERLRPGRELRSRAVDTFRPGWGPSTDFASCRALTRLRVYSLGV